ncbi:Protein of unknown function (DUF4238) [Anaerobutyricum hallii]|uniref:DUF4238 domain-containing protein n=1 Tax=Anaerobutyricum hallii TaxID=39488 RepID=A0A285PTW1_9FIRM|nr:DUF4238 domain-containing protein [Anaerobutyricum hallii]SOB72687.1 Protein of unknown function (DUF4238) [Anaerobutyricum hallii]
MADTKKEHYVPRCYLENFATAGKRIDVFDKWKLMVRTNQDILNVAMENGFYDLDLLRLMKGLKTDVYEQMKVDLMKIVGTDCWNDVEAIIGNSKYIEKKHFAGFEGVYSQLLKSIIGKSYNGNKWVIKNCLAMSEHEKEMLSFFISIQVIRTKKFRETLGDMVAGTAQTLAYKTQMNNIDAQPKEAFEVKANPDFIKLQHSMMILDPAITVRLTEILVDHVWVMCVNKTDIPFYTSDDPVVKIPHKKDKFINYGGFASPGIEIVFPVSSSLLLCMFDSKTYGPIFKDRQFYVMSDVEEVTYYNLHQVAHSYRCVFSNGDDFKVAKKYCKKYPELQEYQSEIEVL